MAAVSTIYATFFLVCFFVLFLILCVKLPEMWRCFRRFCRHTAARRTRKERMLADLERLMAEARRLEGIYCFETVEPHPSPGRGGKSSVRSVDPSRDEARQASFEFPGLAS